jgi:hypothetical protein
MEVKTRVGGLDKFGVTPWSETVLTLGAQRREAYGVDPKNPSVASQAGVCSPAGCTNSETAVVSLFSDYFIPGTASGATPRRSARCRRAG